MFRANWVDLSTDNNFSKVEAALPADKLQGRPLQKLNPRIMRLPFYREGYLVAFSAPDQAPPNDYLFLWSPKINGPATAMNWTNEPIYAFNEADGMQLGVLSLLDYARFFFHFVRGQLGRFIIVESIDEIRWESPEAVEKGIAVIRENDVTIQPLRYKGLHEHAEAHVLTAHIVFKNALFKTDIVVAPYEQDVDDPEKEEQQHFTIGQMELTNEDLLAEELPIAIDQPPGEFAPI